MKPILKFSVFILLAASLFIVSCHQKEIGNQDQEQKREESSSSPDNTNVKGENPPFNLEVILRGAGGRFGHVKFRQDNDSAKIIGLDTWVRDLEPNHEYLLQRAVDVIIDGNCIDTSWLTLGEGLTPRSILTDANGTGKAELWRDISMLASGTVFDIHFRVVDALSMAVVLDSDCYQYVVR